jgi:hypothetical protein
MPFRGKRRGRNEKHLLATDEVDELLIKFLIDGTHDEPPEANGWRTLYHPRGPAVSARQHHIP